jgi:hypothetical protein
VPWIIVPLAIVATVASTRPAMAQAWAPRAREGHITFVAQTIDHFGRVFKDVRFDCCGTTNAAFVVDADYGITDRWSVSAGLPYVFAKYRGGPPDGVASFIPYSQVDSCHCVHSAFQDLAFGTHYNLFKSRRSFSLMTSATLGVPSHSYDYVGEAVVGFDLKELGLSADAGQLLDFLLPGLSVDGHYGYTFVERAVGVSHNRTNAAFDAGYTFPNHLAAHMILSAQRTHGGLRFPDDVRPFPERWTEFHRLLHDDYFQAGAGVSYTWRAWDLSFSFLKTVSGDNTHDVHVYTATTGRSFRLRRQPSLTRESGSRRNPS